MSVASTHNYLGHKDFYSDQSFKAEDTNPIQVTLHHFLKPDMIQGLISVGLYKIHPVWVMSVHVPDEVRGGNATRLAMLCRPLSGSLFGLT